MRNEILWSVIYDCIEKMEAYAQKSFQMADEIRECKTPSEIADHLIRMAECTRENTEVTKRYTKAMQDLFDVNTKTISLSKSKCIALNSDK